MGRPRKPEDAWEDEDFEAEARWRCRHPRKLRGGKRYFRKVAERAERDIQIGGVSDAPDGWSNLWHAHVDWRGFGNRGSRLRRAHLRVLVSMMDRLVERARSCPRPSQIWVQIQLPDSGEDAVYAHTPNPHTKFPADFGDVTWGSRVPDLLRGLVDPARHEVGLYSPRGITILIRPRGHELGSDPNSVAPNQ